MIKLIPQYLMITLIVCSMATYADTTQPTTPQVYRWKDANGEVHFSDTQQPGAEPVPSISPTATPPLNSDLETRNRAIQEQNKQDELDKKLNADQKAEVEQAKQYQDQLKKVCQQYQDNIKMLTEQAGRRIYTVDPQGNYHFFNDDERKRQLAETEANYQKFCVSAPKK